MELQRTPGELAKAARSTKAKKRGVFTRGSIPPLVRGTCLVPKPPNFKAREDIQRLHLRELLSPSHRSQHSPTCALNHSLLVIKPIKSPVEVREAGPNPTVCCWGSRTMPGFRAGAKQGSIQSPLQAMEAKPRVSASSSGKWAQGCLPDLLSVKRRVDKVYKIRALVLHLFLFCAFL